MKGIIVAIFLCVALVTISPETSQADTTVVGTVNHVGQASIGGSNFGVIYMTPTGGTMRTYVTSGSASNSMLAMALTALSTGKTIACQVDSNGNVLVVWVNA